MSKEPFEIEITTQSIKNWYHTTITYIYDYLLDKGILCRECGSFVEVMHLSLGSFGTNRECNTCYYKRLDKNTLKEVKKYPGMTLSTITSTCKQCDETYYRLPTSPTICKRCVRKNKAVRQAEKEDNSPSAWIACKLCHSMHYKKPHKANICEPCRVQLRKGTWGTDEALKSSSCPACGILYHRRPKESQVCELCKDKIKNEVPITKSGGGMLLEL